MEHGLRLSRLHHVFLTRASVSTAGGLAGTLLTLSDAALLSGAPPAELSLHGPPHLPALVASIACTVNAGRHCSVTERPVTGDVGEVSHSDGYLSVSPLLLRACAGVDSTGSVPSGKRARLSPGHAASEAEDAESADAVCYLVRLSASPGKFDPTAAQKLGIPPGRLYGSLAKGERVAVPGLVPPVFVEPHQVVSPPVPGPAVLLIDVPSQAHMDAAETAIAAALAPTEVSSVLSLVVHLTPSHVVSTPRYTAWAGTLGGTHTMHVLANAEAAGTPSVFRASAQLAFRLSCAHPGIFPAAPLDGEVPSLEDPRFMAARNLLKWRLRPAANAGADCASVPARLSATAMAAALNSDVPQLAELVQELRDGWKGRESGVDVPPAVRWMCANRAAAPTLMFLGTGAAIPSKYRNVSCILLRTPGGGALLDCGEGSLGQMERRLGLDGAEEALNTLRVAWISHIHADHHLGLLAVLVARRRARARAGLPTQPLTVVGPTPLRRVLEAHSRLEPLCYRFVDAAETTARASVHIGQLAPHLSRLADDVAALGLRRLVSVPVIHCAHAFAVVAEGLSGWSVVYSGDTRPCPALDAAARGASLLVHEATFEDAMHAEAVAKRHSTTREAVAAGTNAGAYRTLLTHFSQRYPKIPIISDSHGDTTAIAFDGLVFSLADLPHLPAFLPALRALFPADHEESDEEPEDD